MVDGGGGWGEMKDWDWAGGKWDMVEGEGADDRKDWEEGGGGGGKEKNDWDGGIPIGVNVLLNPCIISFII